MESFLERIDRGEVLVGDGAIGSLLMARGLPRGSCPESFNLSHPEVLEEIAALYLEAGADIIQTNTFGGSPLKLANYSLADQTEEVNRRAVSAVKNVVGDRAYVSASCGPTGKLLKPYGDTDPETISAAFHRQLHTLIEAGIDMLCVETMTDIREALLAIKAARAISPGIPIMATMTFDPTPRGFYTVMGVSIQQAAAELEAAGADIIGSNCGNGIEKMIEIAGEFKKYSGKPIGIQANAGLPELKEGTPIYPETPRFIAEKAGTLIDMGVSVIGGCCGTTPSHIRALRQMVDRRKIH